MARTLTLPEVLEEEALAHIIGWLRGGRKASPGSVGNRYDLYIPDVISEMLNEVRQEELQRQPQRGMTRWHYDTATNSSPFYDAAWNLCNRGILRPGVVGYVGEYAAPSGVIGAGFDLTAFGVEWLAGEHQGDAFPVEYKRFAHLLEAYNDRFGAGYASRSQEALRCYRARVYLACCTMCGAAAESILLALAIGKAGSDDEVLREYRRSGGRKKVEDRLISQQNSHVSRELTNFFGLLKYWRDDASHGDAVSIGEVESFAALLLLLRFAQFANDRWEEIVAAEQPAA